jgi:hypothetical protein
MCANYSLTVVNFGKTNFPLEPNGPCPAAWLSCLGRSFMKGTIATNGECVSENVKTLLVDTFRSLRPSK